MASYPFINAFLDLIGSVSTASILVWFVLSLQPLFKRVRDLCRSCQPPEGRGRLLCSVLLIPVVWVAAAAIYFRNLSTLWDTMGTRLEIQPVNRPVYALLHLYLYFLLFSGIYACSVTIVEISRKRKVFSDLLMIARYKISAYQVVEDVEAQLRTSSLCQPHFGTEANSVGSDVRNASLSPQNEELRSNGQGLNENIAPADASTDESKCPMEDPFWSDIDHPIGGHKVRAVDPPMRYGNVECSHSPVRFTWDNSEAAGSSNQCQAVFDSDGHAITASSSASSVMDEPDYVDDDMDRHLLPRVKPGKRLKVRRRSNPTRLHFTDLPGCVRRDNDRVANGLYHATPHLKPQFQDDKFQLKPLEIGPSPSLCDSCSSAHAELIPTAKRSLARVPITPTSPTADAEDADTEKTDIERKKRDRRHRNSAVSTPQILRAKIVPNASASSDTNSQPFRTPIISDDDDDEDDLKAFKPSPAPPALERSVCTSANERASTKPKPKASLRPPPSAPLARDGSSSPLMDPGKVREANHDDHGQMSASSGDNNDGNSKDHVTVSFDRRGMVEERMRTGTCSTKTRRDGGSVSGTRLSPPRTRMGSPYPYPFAGHGRRRVGGGKGRE